ncbi:MAG: hypothetical protein H6707_09135 [Deltaproteobacteria bacterium]|nr:hypothetical protein [Deltaproteobacteria bacterium]
MRRSTITTTLLCGLLGSICGCTVDEHRFSRADLITSQSQTIGGPAASGRVGDFLLQNDRVRAIIRGSGCNDPLVVDGPDGKEHVCPSGLPWRYNQRGTLPVANGSLIDADIQRPAHRYSGGQGSDAFHELGPMVNLQANTSRMMDHGRCGAVGAAPCPKDSRGDVQDCARVSASGVGEHVMGTLALLDIAIQKSYGSKLQIVNDYDLCPGERAIRVTTSATVFDGDPPANPPALEMDALDKQTSLLDVLLGESTNQDCAVSACPTGETCDDLLIAISLGTLNTEMKRCRRPDHKVAGVLSGDFLLFSAKSSVFVPGDGFDHDTRIRSIFDTGGDVFTNPLSIDFVAAVGDGVSYAYFGGNKTMIPVFTETFTLTMTDAKACSRGDPSCLTGNQLRSTRVVGIGHGDVASALVEFYRLRGIATGEVLGHVVRRRDRVGVSHADVFALSIPRAWAQLSDSELSSKSYEQLVAANRSETKNAKNPLGSPGVISHFRTDIGLDSRQDGSFAGPLPVGRFVLVTRSEATPSSTLIPVTIKQGSKTPALLLQPESATLQYDIRNAGGLALPAKLTIGSCLPECARDEDCSDDRPSCDALRSICVPKGGYTAASQCRPDQNWNASTQTCDCPTSARLPLELDGTRRADGTNHVILSASGSGTAQLPPGTYEVIASRGMEYDITRRFVRLRAGSVARLTTTLRRVVDSGGWISADFHVHGPNSLDSSLDATDRITSYAAEGVELVSSSDHDQLTDYAPTAFALGLRNWLKTQVGLEVSTLDYGHFLGFPLRFDERAELNGAIYWRQYAEGADPPWRNITPSLIYRNLRDRGAYGPENTVTAVAHFYDHFSFYDLDPFTMELPALNINSLTTPVLSPLRFSGGFDALEVLNGKALDVIRRPTYKEVRDYNNKLAELLADASLGDEERLLRWRKLSSDAQRALLIRDEAEQKLAISYSNKDFECRCTSDADCGGTPFFCDQKTASCRRSCASDVDCNGQRVGEGRESCTSYDGTVKTCQRVEPACTDDTTCTTTWGQRSESCLAASAGGKACRLSCTRDGDCESDPLRPSCVQNVCVAPTITAAGDNDPCPTIRGTVDDYFQLLNRGVRRTLLGNSDSHDTYGNEAGIPRNFIRSESDAAGLIDLPQTAKNVRSGRSFASYGPFISFSIDDEEIGGTVKATAGQAVTLKMRVQSPLWFDVDRIEIYRNGQLIKTFSGSTTCTDRSQCLRLPNTQIVNFEGQLTDTPQEDSWYAVVAMGVDGKTLAPVYSSAPVARLGLFELLQRLIPLLPPLRSLRTPMSPTISVVRPYAITNPIWVDIGGDGLTPVATPPGWSEESAQPMSLALNQDAAHDQAHRRGEAHTHDHRRGLAKMRERARALVDELRSGRIDTQTLSKAINQLRYRH